MEMQSPTAARWLAGGAPQQEMGGFSRVPAEVSSGVARRHPRGGYRKAINGGSEGSRDGPGKRPERGRMGVAAGSDGSRLGHAAFEAYPEQKKRASELIVLKPFMLVGPTGLEPATF